MKIQHLRTCTISNLDRFSISSYTSPREILWYPNHMFLTLRGFTRGIRRIMFVLQVDVLWYSFLLLSLNSVGWFKSPARDRSTPAHRGGRGSCRGVQGSRAASPRKNSSNGHVAPVVLSSIFGVRGVALLLQNLFSSRSLSLSSLSRLEDFEDVCLAVAVLILTSVIDVIL